MSAVTQAKDLIVAALQADTGLGAHVSREYPKDPLTIKTDRGVADGVWIGRDGGQAVSGELEIPFIGKALPLVTRERFTIWLTCQSLKNDSLGTNKNAQDRAYELRTRVIRQTALDPTLGFTTSETNHVKKMFVENNEWSESGGYLDAGVGCAVAVGLRFWAQVEYSN